MLVHIRLTLGEGDTPLCYLSKTIEMSCPDAGSYLEVGGSEPIKIISINPAGKDFMVFAESNIYEDHHRSNLDERDTATFIQAYIESGFVFEHWFPEGRAEMLKRDGKVPDF